MMAGDLARMLDPVLMANDVGITSLDPWQQRLLHDRPRRSLLCALANQVSRW